LKIQQILCHQNIVKCFDLFHYSNSLFIVYEKSEEEDLSQFIDKITDEAEILRIIFQMIQGLKYLHEHNINPHDIIRENIMMCQNE
jgi:serine/threonine protein kinase